MWDKKAYMKEYRFKNKERIKECRREWDRKYYLKNKEHIKEYQEEYHLRNKEQQKEYRLKNKERRNEHARERYQNDPNFRIIINLRTRLTKVLKGTRKSARTIKLLGCTIEELWQHLESSSTWEPWMTRENYGIGGWDIDHIKACTKFDLTDPEQQQECCNWSNLQPMEHIANIKKGNR